MQWKVEKDIKGFNKIIKLIPSLSEFIGCVEWIWREYWTGIKYDTETPWFRGVSNSEYDLEPGLYRETLRKPDISEEEALGMSGEFARRSIPFLKSKIASEGENYHLMQHYGMPTRLLDWTEGSLIALFFSIRTFKHSSIPCVWMLNPWRLNKFVKSYNIFYTDYSMSMNKEEKEAVIPYFYDRAKTTLPVYPIAVLPPHIVNRIVAQRSVFTLHGKKGGINKLLQKDKKHQVFQIRLDPKHIDKLKEQIVSLGISETSLFPGLEGLAKEIKWEYGIS